jgi:hypothetical protein
MALRPEELEAEADRTRARMTALLDQLRRRVTPGQIVDQAIEYTQHGAPADFLRNLGREIRDNPLPLVLIAAGIAWLAIATARSTRGRRATPTEDDALADEAAALPEDGLADLPAFSAEDEALVATGEELVGETDWQRPRATERLHEPR